MRDRVSTTASLDALETRKIFFFAANCFSFMAQQPLVGQGLLITVASQSHSDTPHSVEIPWTSDQPAAETSTWQNTTLTKDKHQSPGGIRTHNPNKPAAADPRLRPRGHLDRPFAVDGLRYSVTQCMRWRSHWT
jgi:hypothetical protein